MSERRIFLDPDGCGTGWLFVIVAAPTGVLYQNQGGGYSCRQYEQEGYLIPVPGTDLTGELEQVFVEELRGRGTYGLEWPPELLARLRAAVADIHLYGSANRDDPWPAPLVLDESRLAEADEAWVPVLTPDGPGVLVWENSD
ncbi:DUF6210 family protein [Kitasatospora sp. NPDC057198]|uniref:DUF6210 family protein n=1 Tax=Kitasatospora sp. NPDC057198 TaxID=3346046 RepID=UPI00363012BE